MKFNKKFNIKHLVTISSITLAMIGGGIASTVNVNTNIHAESVAQKEDEETKIMDARNQKSYDAYQKEQAKEALPNREAYEMMRIHDNLPLNSDVMNDSGLHQYLNSKGYSDSFLKNRVVSDTTPTNTRVDPNKTAPSSFKTYEKAIGESDNSDSSSSDSSNAPVHIHYPKALIQDDERAEHKAENHNHNHNHNTRVANSSKFKSKRTHLSKSMLRKIMKQIRLDKKDIRNDKNHLSTRNAKRFIRNYTKRSKSIKRTKHIQKRAMAVKGAKRYVHYYKDEVKHEKDLVRLIKSTRVSKVTKRHARKSLKRVRKNIRKNRKNVKGVHKITRHKRSNKNHK